MEIQIVDKWADIVLVNSAVGCFKGIWCSSTPVVSKKYIVEIDSDDVLTKNEVELSNSCTPCIENVDQETVITGLVKQIQDNVMVLCLQKSIVMLEVSDSSNFLKYIGHYIHVTLSGIKLYDTGIY